MLHLPEEVLEHIFSRLQYQWQYRADHATNQEGIQTLLSICQASRAFNRIARPLLYRTLTPLLHGGPGNLKCLLETFARVPELAGHALELRCGPLIPGAVSETAPLDDTTAGRLMDLVEEHDTTFSTADRRDMLLTGLLEGVYDAQLAILLLICTNLEVVDFKLPDELFAVSKAPYELPIVHDALRLRWRRQRNDHHSALTSLRRISLWGREPYPCGRGFGRMEKITKLPAAGAIEVRWRRHKVSLQAAVLNGQALECQLVSLGPSLTSLNLTWNIQNWSNDHSDAFGYDRLPELLRTYCCSLQSLVIRSIEHLENPGCIHVVDFPQAIPALGSLRSFSVLGRLKVPIELLMGRDFDDDQNVLQLKEILPSSLRTLELQPIDLNALLTAYGLHRQLADVVHEPRFTALMEICLKSQDELESEPRFLPLEFGGWRQESTPMAVIYRKS